ncbi:hypothetical protein LIER_12284 [Lithospermum erythrorhizon]|uniref:NAC domain-containing protein n=1 Tax=Lithospermum erythrorhizon TaxID=34254 RepID=A0AAV3PWC3_LITER
MEHNSGKQTNSTMNIPDEATRVTESSLNPTLNPNTNNNTTSHTNSSMFESHQEIIITTSNFARLKIGHHNVSSTSDHVNNIMNYLMRPAQIQSEYRFCPSDEELIYYYLQRKIMNLPLPLDNTIMDVDLYHTTPYELCAN